MIAAILIAATPAIDHFGKKLGNTKNNCEADSASAPS
jgi:hypothetical protein